MNPVLVLLLSASVTLAFTGCGETHATPPAHGEPATAASTYKAGYGLRLTDAARSFVGLQTGEVASHTFASGVEAAAIPASALLRTVKGDFVYVSNGGWFLRTPVTLGMRDATHLEVKDGLYDGDTIVVEGVGALSLAEIQALNGGVGCADGH